ncbi:uncharacterized protein [Argopecten irradians]|uniref:uncharacterized protein n=1 Tax=Argopecten irradians TaxID=31199 RepID=UPI00371B401A
MKYFTSLLVLLGVAALASGTRSKRQALFSRLFGTSHNPARRVELQFGYNGKFPRPGGMPSPTGQPFTGQPSITGQPFTGWPSTGQPFTGRPFTGQPFTGQPFTGQPYTNRPFTGANYQTGNLYDRQLKQILHEFRSLTTDQVQPATTSPTINDDVDIDKMKTLVECWFNEIMGGVFNGFPTGHMNANLTIHGSKVHYILSRAIRQYQLSNGDVDDVLRNMVRGLIWTAVVPHRSCPATKFHQVSIWALRSLMQYHLSNDAGSLREQFKAILTSFNFHSNSIDTLAANMVSEIHGHLIGGLIQNMKFEVFNDFFEPLEYIVEEMVAMFGAPRSSSKIDELLRVVVQTHPWLLQCITPQRLVEMHLDIVNNILGFLNAKELGEFLDRVQGTLKEEFLLATGNEQIPLVHTLAATLETHIQEFVNGSSEYATILLTGNTNQLIKVLSPLMSQTQLEYFQRILTSLGSLNYSTTPAPVTNPSNPNGTPSGPARRKLE